MIITNSDDEIGLSLGNIGKDLECSIVIEQRQREYSIFACIIIADASDVRFREDQGCAGWRVFIDSRNIAEGKEKRNLNAMMQSIEV